jgi:hypothetical protein
MNEWGKGKQQAKGGGRKGIMSLRSHCPCPLLPLFSNGCVGRRPSLALEPKHQPTQQAAATTNTKIY